jgi:hypothetical protein
MYMTDDDASLSQAQLRQLIEKLEPPNEEMDEASADIILRRAGVDVTTLQADLKKQAQAGSRRNDSAKRTGAT